MSQEIAFLGLGLMGAPMAANLARQGYNVIAWNRTSDRPGVEIAKQGGATIVSSIAEAVANAEIILTCVGDVPDVKEVLLAGQGVINYARPNSLIVDMSTIGSNAAKEIKTELNKRQLRFMDAPVSGGGYWGN